MKSFQECLADQNRTTLEAIARMRGVEEIERSSKDLVAQLARELLRPESVAHGLEELSPEERDALEAIVAEGGKMKEPPLVRSFGKVRRLGELQLQRLEPWRNPAGPAEALYYRGLLFRGYDIIGAYHGPVLFIPPDLLALLPSVHRPQPAFELEMVPEPLARKASGLSLLEEALAYLVFLQRESIHLEESGHLPVAAEARLVSELGMDQERVHLLCLDFLHQICREAKLVGVRQGELKPLPTAREWLKAPRVQQIKTLFDAWAESRRWNDLWHVESLRPESAGWRNDPFLARQAVLEHLRNCPSEEWISLSSLVSFIHEADPDFQRVAGDYSSWYIHDTETGEDLAGFENWFRVEGALIAYLISYPLNWLGALDVGQGEEGLASFCITQLGAYLLDTTPQSPPQLPERPLAVESDFQVLAPREAPPYHRFQLARFAELERRDVVSLYRITRESIWGALDRGISIQSIVGFLQRASGGKTPQNVVRTLGEWGGRYGEIQLERTAVLRARDEALLRELQALPEVQPYIREILSPRAALIDPEDLDRLLEILRRLGYAPRLE